MASGPERVQAALDALGLGVQVVRVPGTAKTAVQAAESVGCAVSAIVKSMVFLAGEQAVVVLCAGDRRVDTAKLAALLGVAAVGMAPAEVVRRATGYAIGGVPPFGHASPLPVFMDRDLERYGVVWAAAGRPDAVFPISPSRLAELSGASVAELK